MLYETSLVYFVFSNLLDFELFRGHFYFFGTYWAVFRVVESSENLFEVYTHKLDIFNFEYALFLNFKFTIILY